MRYGGDEREYWKKQLAYVFCIVSLMRKKVEWLARDCLDNALLSIREGGANAQLPCHGRSGFHRFKYRRNPRSTRRKGSNLFVENFRRWVVFS